MERIVREMKISFIYSAFPSSVSRRWRSVVLESMPPVSHNNMLTLSLSSERKRTRTGDGCDAVEWLVFLYCYFFSVLQLSPIWTSVCRLAPVSRSLDSLMQLRSKRQVMMCARLLHWQWDWTMARWKQFASIYSFVFEPRGSSFNIFVLVH